MEPITTALIASSLAAGFASLGEQLVGKTLLDPLLDPVAEQLSGYLPQKLRRKDERALQKAVENALHAAGAPTGDGRPGPRPAAGDPGRTGGRQEHLAALYCPPGGLWLWHGTVGSLHPLAAHQGASTQGSIQMASLVVLSVIGIALLPQVTSLVVGLAVDPAEAERFFHRFVIFKAGLASRLFVADQPDPFGASVVFR